jgi:hypothetical protein
MMGTLADESSCAIGGKLLGRRDVSVYTVLTWVVQRSLLLCACWDLLKGIGCVMDMLSRR